MSHVFKYPKQITKAEFNFMMAVEIHCESGGAIGLDVAEKYRALEKKLGVRENVSYTEFPVLKWDKNSMLIK